MKTRYLVFSRGGSGFAYFHGGFDSMREAHEFLDINWGLNAWVEERQYES